MPSTVPRSRLMALIALALAAGSIVRLAFFNRPGLWEDEIIAVTHATQPAWQIPIETFRYDVHPPLYFMQLHLWSLLGTSDLWFTLNSVLLGLAAPWLLWRVLARDGEAEAAPIAAALLAVLPAGFWMAQEVRPYAWLTLLYIAAYRLIRLGFATPAPPRWARPALALVGMMIAYSHAIGCYAVLFLGLYALLTLAHRPGATRRDYLAWLLVHVAVAVIALPVLARNTIADANLIPVQSWSRLAFGLSTLITVSDLTDWILPAGLVLYLAIIAAGLAYRPTRLLTATLLVAPAAVAIPVGVLFQPILKANFFATLCFPFIAIVLARLVIATPARLRAACLAGMLAISLAVGLSAWSRREETSDFRLVAHEIAARLRPGDVIYAPQGTMFWGLAWYLAGPHWGSDLRIAPPPSPAWQRLYDRLGPRLVDLLGLRVEAHGITLPDGTPLLVGPAAEEEAARAKRVWMLALPRTDLDSQSSSAQLGPLHRREQRPYARLMISLYE